MGLHTTQSGGTRYKVLCAVLTKSRSFVNYEGTACLTAANVENSQKLELWCHDIATLTSLHCHHQMAADRHKTGIIIQTLQQKELFCCSFLHCLDALLQNKGPFMRLSGT